MNATADNLLAAVNKYHATGDGAVLVSALRRHESRQRARAKPESFATTLRRGFMSLNPWPTDAHDECMEIIGNRPDAESIASHWRTVGEYLSYGIAKYAVENGLPRKTAAGASLDETIFSQPLPPADILAQYKSIDPDIPDRIIKIAEDEQLADIALHKKELDDAVNNRTKGQRWALILSVLTVLCFTLLIAGGYAVYGALLFGGAAVGLGYVFIAGRGRASSSPNNEF